MNPLYEQMRASVFERMSALAAEHDITTTPLIFIDRERIGGAKDLEHYLESVATT